MKPLLIVGAGEHAKVILDIAFKNQWRIAGFLDDREEIREFCGVPILGNTDMAFKFIQNRTFFLAIGNNQKRKELAERYKAAEFAALVHPHAVISPWVTIGRGSAVMANAVINPGACIGEHCIINTGCIVEHDCKIGNYVHLSPGCRLGGGVRVGEECWLGIGCCVRDHLRIHKGCTVGMGAIVLKNIERTGTYVGMPARPVR